ncbi:MAG TPA: hypothetical protein VNZ45_06235 [Bacteroidia bacterium]|jgi:hypothetical protein|nr:hypothetical protein [Bacteroidia bacterium]
MSIKNILFIPVFVFIISFANAGPHYGRQGSGNDHKKFSFSFNPGYGIPLMDFAKKAYLPIKDSLHAYGFANPGFHFEVCATYLFTEYVGVAADFGGTICPFDDNAYAAAYTSVYPTSFLVPTNSSVSANGSNFIAQYLGGPYFYIPINDKFCFEIRILAGLISSTYPDITITSNVPNNYSSYFYKYAVGQGFGYGASVGGKYMIDPNVGVVANVSYTGGTMTYAGLDYNYTTPSGFLYGGFSFSDRTMSVGIVSITAGLALCF